MKVKELSHVFTAIFVLTGVAGFTFGLNGDWISLGRVFSFSVVLILGNIFTKKWVAYKLDLGVEHEIWRWGIFGFKPHQKFKSPIMAGIIMPLIFTIFTLGIFKVMTFLTYEARALKRRAAKRFGYYSYSGITDWHNGLIGASGVLFALILSVISYFIPLDGFGYLSRMASYYGFWSLIPFSKLDGMQIYFGSKSLWSVLMIISLLFLAWGFVIV
jgi:hypothetical protein